MVTPTKPEQDLMIKVAFIVRSTLFKVKGGDTVQVTETAAALAKLGVLVDIKLACGKINYEAYDLLHFFNITRPVDIWIHARRSRKPYVITPIWIDYSRYDRLRTGFTGRLFRLLNRDAIEYLKTMGRFVLGKDKLVSRSFAWRGQRRSIRSLLAGASCLLVNSENEYQDIFKAYGIEKAHTVVPNGIDESWLEPMVTNKEADLILCVARIEGLKNQLNLIKAVNGTTYRLVLIGAPAPNQLDYYEQCKKIAGPNVEFKGWLDVPALKKYYARAKVHVLPSYFELCGLSSLEAAAMKCSIVIGNNGYAKDYFGDDAFYCEAADPVSIRKAIDAAAIAVLSSPLREKIRTQYNWQQAAEKIVPVYKKILA